LQRSDDYALRSVTKQLEYLIEFSAGKRNDRERLKDITIGILTVREIEVLDAGLAEKLYQVDDEVEQMRRER